MDRFRQAGINPYNFNSNKVRLRPLERKVEKDNVIQEV